MELKNKKVAVLGAGISGKAAASFVQSKQAQVTLYDIRKEEDFGEIEKIKGVKTRTGISVEEVKDLVFDLVIISPGISIHSSWANAFIRNSRESMGELELATRFYRGKVIAITGTNGKSSTTEMVRNLIVSMGKTCVACGNYGLPLCKVLQAEILPEYLALEVSSFQLESIKTFAPDVSVWLNFAADHLDRHGSLEEYYRIKSKIFSQQNKEQVAIVPQQKFDLVLKSKIVTFGYSNESHWQIVGENIYYRSKLIVDLAGKNWLKHLFENAAAAIASVATLDELFLSKAQQVLENYQPALHRCEDLGLVKGVKYINDSKSTNLHSLLGALNSLDGKILLIAGGKEKGMSYEKLIPFLGSKVTKLVIFGENSKQLQKNLPKGFPVYKCQDLKESLRIADQLVEKTEKVLFSPATSSLDQFDDYQQRGETFRELVDNLR